MNLPSIHAPNVFEPAYNMLKALIESRAAKRVNFEIGHLIQCSWMWFKVETHEGKEAIFAPRIGETPMRFMRDCSDALNLILTQRYICDSFGVDYESCNARQSAIVIKDIEDCKEIFMNRTDGEDGSVSGWYFGAQDSKLNVDKAENFDLKSLWELSCLFPETMEFFLLPVGWQVVFEKKPTVLMDFKPSSPQSGSYFEARYGK